MCHGRGGAGSGGTPTWVWILIVAAVALLAAGGAVVLHQRRGVGVQELPASPD